MAALAAVRAAKAAITTNMETKHLSTIAPKTVISQITNDDKAFKTSKDM